MPYPAIYLFLCLAAVAAVRLIPSWIWPCINSDAGFHLLLRREIARNRGRIPRRLPVCQPDRIMTHPWLYHWCILPIPEKWLRRCPGLPNAVIDMAHAAVAFFFAGWLCEQWFPDANPIRAGLWAALLLGLNPALLAHGMGPRAYTVTPRPFGEWLFTVQVLAALIFAESGHAAWAALSIAAGAGICLSSKFAAQVSIFFIIPMAFVPGLHSFAWLLAAAFAAAFLLSGGRYAHVLRSQLTHLNYYRTHLQYTFSLVFNLNRWDNLAAIARTARRDGFTSKPFLRVVASAYFSNTYLLMLTRGTIFLLLLVSIPAMSENVELASGMPSWFLAWAFIWIVPFLVTSLKHVRFLGEAERYAEFSLFPACVLAASALATGVLSAWMWAALILFALSAVVVWLHAVKVHANLARRVNRPRAELVEFLQTLPHGSLLLGLPANQLLCPIASQLPHRFADVTSDLYAFIRLIKENYEGYPWPKPDWDFWRERGVEYLISLRPDELRAERPSLAYDFSSLNRLFSNDLFCVYRL